jgi:two-component system, cell cycle sensor histidine kinase and response regulator CckA
MLPLRRPRPSNLHVRFRSAPPSALAPATDSDPDALKRAEAALAENQARVRALEERARLGAIVSSSDDAIIAKTADGTVTHWNAAAERIFGFTADEMLGRSIFAIVPPERIDEEREQLRLVQQGTPINARTAERLTKRGERLTVSLTLSPMYDDRGVCIGISSIARDIGAKLQLTAQLAQAQKLEAIGLLAGGVAHDLNNFLSAVLGGLELAATSSSLDAETRADFEEIRKEGFRATVLIRQLLAVARRQVIHPVACDLNEIVRELVPMLGHLLHEDITLETTLEATRGVLVDSAQMSQVVLNLCVNARDAMPDGGLLTISTCDDADGTDVALRVTDTGCGMAPDVQAHLFEPFFTTKGPGVGTGLGLSTSYGIVAQSGGAITVSSQVGVGSSFTVSLPAVSTPVPVTFPPSKAPVASRDSETILVVEDNRVLRDQIVRGLSRLGYRVLEAQNGADALEMHPSAPIDLVLSDVVMPEMNGPELVSHLRQWYPTIRVLFMSGYSPEAVRSHGILVTDTTLLQKPFDLTELATRVRAALATPSSQSPASCEARLEPVT